MKVIVMENNYSPAYENEISGWYFIADSAVTNTGKPFYIPDNLGRVEVSLSIAIRINRLGKCVASKFASRYYNQVAPALHFKLPQYGQLLRESKLSEDPSRSFDKSLFIGEFQHLEDFSNPFALTVNGVKEPIFEFDLDKLVIPVNEVLSRVSELNTLKMGDFILPGLSESYKVSQGDLLEVVQANEKKFHVKVK